MALFAVILIVACGLSAALAQDGSAGCVLPARPENGNYTVRGRPLAEPGQTLEYALLTVTCDPGYGVIGVNVIYCFAGTGNTWSAPAPQCVKHCQLTPDHSVRYHCRVFGEYQLQGTRLCQEYEPNGTVVLPECNRPVYYTSGVLLDMHCNDGSWDYVAICQPGTIREIYSRSSVESYRNKVTYHLSLSDGGLSIASGFYGECGTPAPKGEQLIINGARARHGDFPWHAAIYNKLYTPYMQICGGSLISTAMIISAAHCFWFDGEGLKPSSQYAVALGNIHRPWRAEPGVHQSDVRSIQVPVLYMSGAGHYQEDIALVTLATPVVYATHILPVCINFNEQFDRSQLQNANMGKVAGWGLTSVLGVPSQILQTTELPYVDPASCIRGLPTDFRPYITSDKICAGYINGSTTVCKGDSGGGLVFPAMERDILRYYLRGVVSSAPTPATGLQCNANSYTSFTHVLKHATFIKDGLATGSINNRVTSQHTPSLPGSGSRGLSGHASPETTPELTIVISPISTTEFGIGEKQDSDAAEIRHVYGLMGPDLQLECDVSEKQNVKWTRREGKQLREIELQRTAVPTGDTLIIENLAASDAGLYKCEAENQQGTVFNITVFTPPIITVQPHHRVTRIGESETVLCLVSGAEEGTIHWKPSGKPFSSRVIANGSRLIFHGIQEEDAGTYYCTASNGPVAASAEVTINVIKGVPEVCDCRGSQFGCCGDDLTAASGPDQVGCDCSASRHGCCPDGLAAASGQNFAGCNSLPVNRQAACHLPRIAGACQEYVTQWYFDMHYGGCSRFWYGGCGGNGNRFATEEECESVCIHPPGTEVCQLPRIRGACEVSLTRWHFDSESKTCSDFTFSGCLGNDNNFETADLCQKRCQPSPNEDLCNLSIDRGSCAGNFSRWGFDANAGQCVGFSWGGCEGNSNRFSSQSACTQRCQPTAGQELTDLPARMLASLQVLKEDNTVQNCLSTYAQSIAGHKNVNR